MFSRDHPKLSTGFVLILKPTCSYPPFHASPALVKQEAVCGLFLMLADMFALLALLGLLLPNHFLPLQHFYSSCYNYGPAALHLYCSLNI